MSKQMLPAGIDQDFLLAVLKELVSQHKAMSERNIIGLRCVPLPPPHGSTLSVDTPSSASNAGTAMMQLGLDSSYMKVKDMKRFLVSTWVRAHVKDMKEALKRYKEIVPHVQLAGPRSLSPIIDMAIDIVEQSGRQYHVLLIIACGQVILNDVRSIRGSNLIFGVDFTKSNEETGARSFRGQCLHKIETGPFQNPCEQAIASSGRALSTIQADDSILCFGFGDAKTKDQKVFSFNPEERPCRGYEEALNRYKDIATQLQLGGPTSFAPLIETALDIVERSGRKYHILLIFTSGQFVDFTEIMSKQMLLPRMAQEYAHAALKELVSQHKAMSERYIIGWRFGKRRTFGALLYLMGIPNKAKRGCVPFPPPHGSTLSVDTPSFASNAGTYNKVCGISFDNPKDMAFGCGHVTCCDCGHKVPKCPFCNSKITSRLRLYN